MFCNCIQTDLATGLSHVCIVCRSPAMQSGRAFNSAATQNTIFLLHTILCMTGRCHQFVRNLALGISLSVSSEEEIVWGAVRALRDSVEALSDAAYTDAVYELSPQMMGLSSAATWGGRSQCHVHACKTACNGCDVAVCSQPCQHYLRAICALCKDSGLRGARLYIPSCPHAMLCLYSAPGHLVTVPVEVYRGAAEPRDLETMADSSNNFAASPVLALDFRCCSMPSTTCG